MKTKINIPKAIIASLLLITWVLPTYLHFSHHLEDGHCHNHTAHHTKEKHSYNFGYIACQKDHHHNHAVSDEKQDQLTEYNVRCAVCDYQFSSFIYEFEIHPETIVTPIISKITHGVITSLCYSSSITNTQLRAPPMSA